MPAPNPEAVRQRVGDAARQRTGWPAPLDPGPGDCGAQPRCLPARSGRWPSWMSRSEATRSTPSWARMWWSSRTARADPARQPAAPGRSSGGPTALTDWLPTGETARAGAIGLAHHALGRSGNCADLRLLSACINHRCGAVARTNRLRSYDQGPCYCLGLKRVIDRQLLCSSTGLARLPLTTRDWNE